MIRFSDQTSDKIVAAAVLRTWVFPDLSTIEGAKRLGNLSRYRPVVRHSHKKNRLSVLVQAKRHSQCLAAFADAGMTVAQVAQAKTRQGFVDLHGNFYSRGEALRCIHDYPDQIADPARRQILLQRYEDLCKHHPDLDLRFDSPDSCLYSEDLW